jgi:hypothetical protein
MTVGVTYHSVTQKPQLRLVAWAFSKWKLGHRPFKAGPTALAQLSFFEPSLAWLLASGQSWHITSDCDTLD